MQMNTFNEAVTIIHKSGDAWIKTTYNNASWYATQTRNTPEQTTSFNNSVICRILGTDINVALGDYMVKGTVSEEITSSNILNVMYNYKPKSYKITMIRINTSNPIPHYRLEGE